MERLKKNRKSAVSALFFGEQIVFYLFTFFALLLIFVSLFQPQLTSKIKISVIDIISPILSSINRPFEEASQSINSISNIAALKAENERLQAENDRLKEWYQTALMLKAENKALQSLLNLKAEPEKQYISAKVISDTQNTFSKTLLISAGQDRGLLQDQIVLGGQGVLGRIIEVGKSTSRVLLVTDINSRIPVAIEDSNMSAILSGNNEEYLSLNYIDFVGQELAGQKVITTGEGGIFPAGLSVGRIENGENSSFIVIPFTQMTNIEFVKILNNVEEKLEPVQ